MEAKEIFNIAASEYEAIEQLICKLGALIEKTDSDFSTEKSLFQFDLILQCILFRTAIIDSVFDHNEKIFIDSITRRGDVLNLLNRERDLNLSWDTISLLTSEQMMTVSNLIEDSVKKYANNFILPFAALDALIVEKDFLDEIQNHISIIVKCFAEIDGETDEIEMRAAAKQTIDILVGAWAEVKGRAEAHLSHSRDRATNTESEGSSLKELYLKKKILNSQSDSIVNYCNDKANVQKAVIYIETNHGSGTGFIISEDGYAITCAHVVNNATEIYVKVNRDDGAFEVFESQLIAMDTSLDIALIKIEEGRFNFTELDLDREKPNLAEEIVLYGYPFGSRMNDNVNDLNISFAKGYVSSNQVESGVRKTFLDISAKAGNSGSPIISAENGKVIGILAGSILEGQRHVEEINYMIPIDYIKKFFSD